MASALVLVLATGGTPSLAYQRPGTIERVSIDLDGMEFASNAPSGQTVDSIDGVSMSPNGRFVAFINTRSVSAPGAPSTALVNVTGVYLRDRLTHTTTLISAAREDNPGQSLTSCGGADQPAVSANGRYVAFTSCVDQQVYVRDVKAGTTTLVSVNNTGVPMGGSSPTISDDGHRIAFSGNLAGVGGACTPGTDVVSCEQQDATFMWQQVFVRDMRSHKTILASAAPDGTPANGAADNPTISPDGRFVLFLTTASNLSSVDLDTCPLRYLAAAPTCPDAYLHDLKTGRTELISMGLDGRAGSAEAGFRGQMISRNDRYVAFQSTGTDLVPAGGLPGAFALYVRDRQTGRTERADVDSSGTPAPAGDALWSLSADGRYLAFEHFTYCNNTTAGLHDLLTGATTAVGYRDRSRFCSGKDGGASFPQVSSNGRFIAFVSSSGKLTPGDTNGVADVFVQDRGDALATTGLHTVNIAASGQPQQAGSLLTAADVDGDTDSGWSALGGDLHAATVAYRPGSDDLFVRLAVAHMPTHLTASPVEYGLSFDVNDTNFLAQVTCGGPAGGGTLTLTRRDAGSRPVPRSWPAHCGTTGQEVVWTLPVSALTQVRRVQVRPIVAFTGIAGLPHPMMNDRLTFGSGPRDRR